MTPEEIESQLGNFMGSETLTKWSALFRNDVLTEGAKFVAENCGAYWLMDAIASHQLDPRVKKERFQNWNLVKKGGKKWWLYAEDGNDNQITEQHISYSDFPLEKIELWAVRNELGGITIMLPSEY